MTTENAVLETPARRRWRLWRDAIDIASAISLVTLLVAVGILSLSLVIMPFSKSAGLYMLAGGMFVGCLGGLGACVSLFMRFAYPICPPGNGDR